ncbi:MULTISPECIES: RNA polymerase sigma factor [Aeromicrobium]|uniref:RNA polymerase sigma factor n=1 Tax=Aeromicrobium TaxID=2040 RepID=UPI0009E861A8|nr:MULTISPECIES: sigma-70 family RNA polymerase sigma factor [Aeromicrobium]MCL8252768.1 sigma-70 family RNA polymerase sigma factor [Aeromicrobium fastidiosum]
MDPEPDDDELVRAARHGDHEAFGALFARHVGVARRVARRLGPPADVDDVVAEVFAGVLSQMRAGRGPTASFRAYLLTGVRHEARRRAVLRRRCVPFADLERWPADPGPSGSDDRLLEAYASLPPRWRRTLWQLEVEGRRPRELAAELGLSPNAVSALGYRARAALRTAYLERSRAA